MSNARLWTSRGWGPAVRGARTRRATLLAVLVLTGCAVERPARPAVGPGLVLPPLLSGFGPRHAGIDIRVALGTPVLAAADGIVRLVADRPRAGRMVVVIHGDALATVYMHLSQITVRVDQPVRRGDPIGRAGMTGNATTPHLHFGVCRRPGGRCGARIAAGWDDPRRYWVDGNPCYDPGREYPPAPAGLTYPVDCERVA